MVQFTRFVLGVSAPELECGLHHQFIAELDSKNTPFLLFISLVTCCEFVLCRGKPVTFC